MSKLIFLLALLPLAVQSPDSQKIVGFGKIDESKPTNDQINYTFAYGVSNNDGTYLKVIWQTKNGEDFAVIYEKNGKETFKLIAEQIKYIIEHDLPLSLVHDDQEPMKTIVEIRFSRSKS